MKFSLHDVWNYHQFTKKKNDTYRLKIKIPLDARYKFPHRSLIRFIIQYLTLPVCENSWVEAIHLYEKCY